MRPRALWFGRPRHTQHHADAARRVALRYLAGIALLVVSACGGAVDVEGATASSPPPADASDRPSARPTSTEQPFTAHDAEQLFRATLAEVESVLGELDIAVQAPALEALGSATDVEQAALEVAFDALMRRQEAEDERLERRFGRINADADKADRRCGDDPDCLLASLRAYEKATDRHFARVDRTLARHDEEADWLIARMEGGSTATPSAPGGRADGGGDATPDAADDVSHARDLRVGDCFDSASQDTFREVHVVPCGQPHQYEAIGVSRVPENVDTAQERCVREFERRLGEPVDQADVSLLFGFVAGSTTDDGRASVVCFVAAPDDGLLQGAVVPRAL